MVFCYFVEVHFADHFYKKMVRIERFYARRALYQALLRSYITSIGGSTMFSGLGLGFRPMVHGTSLEPKKVLCKNMFLDF